MKNVKQIDEHLTELLNNTLVERNSLAVKFLKDPHLLDARDAAIFLDKKAATIEKIIEFVKS